MKVKVEKIVYKWYWIAKHQNWKKILIRPPVWIWEVDIIIKKNKKDYYEAITNCEKVSICKHHFCNWWGCWWCLWQVFDYEEQLLYKQMIVEDALRKLNLDINKIIWSDIIYWYRNKVEFSFWKNVWFHEYWRWDKIVDVEWCYLIDKKMNEIFLRFKNFLKDKLPYYDLKTHKWILRSLILRKTKNWIMCNLVVNKTNINFFDFFKNFDFSDINTFIVSFNSSLSGHMQYIDEYIYIKNEQVYETLNLWDELKFIVSPFSFFQVNTNWIEKLLLYLINNINKYDIWLDLYCWTWLFWITLSYFNKIKKLIGIEIIKQAIDDANINAELNNINNYQFIVWKVENINLNYNSDLIIVDPPRDGLHKNVIKFLINYKKHKKFDLIYISCNPVTLARDLEILVGTNLFKIKTVQPFDLFPHTRHVENVVLIE